VNLHLRTKSVKSYVTLHGFRLMNQVLYELFVRVSDVDGSKTRLILFLYVYMWYQWIDVVLGCITWC